MKLADMIILTLAITVNILLFSGSRDGSMPDHAYIQVGDQGAIKVTLANDQIIDIDGLLGKTSLQIQNGAIRFLDSPCLHKICMRHGWLQHSGESSACLPNGLSVRLAGSKPRFDSTNF